MSRRAIAMAASLHRVSVALLAMIALFAGQMGVAAMLDSARLELGFHDACYGLWFALLTWLVVLLLERRFAAMSPRLWLAGLWFGMLGLTALTELARVFIDQPPGIRDPALSMLGVTATVALWGAAQELVPRRAALLLAALVLGLSTWPFWQAQALQAYRDSLAPELVRMDEPRSQALIESNSTKEVVEAPQGWTSQRGSEVLKVTFRRTEFPMVRFPEPVPDWGGYSQLVLELYQATEHALPLYLNLVIRLRGEAEPIERAFELEPGAHRIELALDELLVRPTDRIAGLRLHTNEDFRDFELYIAGLRLE